MDAFALETTLKALLAGAAAALCCWSAGRLALARLPGFLPRLTKAEAALFSFGTGAALLSALLFALGLANLYYDAVFAALLAGAPLAWAAWGRRERPAADAGPLPSRGWRRLSLAIFAAYGVFYGVNTLAPETGSDSVGYHLALVFRYYRDHALTPVTTSVYGFLSQGMELLYLLPFSLARHSGPKLLHFTFFIATALGLVAFGRRFGVPRAGYAAALLYFCSPVVGTDAVTAYNDCALAFLEFLLLYGLLLWSRSGDSRWPLVIGLLAGFCVAVKFTAVFAAGGALIALAALAFRRAPSPGRAIGVVAPAFLLAALVAVPWVARNWIVAGNPVAPLFNRAFPNPYVTVDWERHYREHMAGYRYPDERRGWRDAAELPLEATVWGLRLGGLTGPVFLAAPLALAAWRRPLFWPLVLAAALAGLPWLSNVGARFLIPALVFVSLLMGLAIETLGRRWGTALGFALVGFHALTSWYTVIPLWNDRPFWRLPEFPLRAALRIEPEPEYYSRRIGDFHVVQALKKIAPPGSRVLAFGGVPHAFFPGEVIMSYEGALGEELTREFFTAIEQDFQPTRLLTARFDERHLDGFRILQTAGRRDSSWEVAEVTLLRNGAPLVLPPGSEAQAELRPWSVDRVIDGDPLTIWRTWRSLEPAQLTLTFPQPLTADGARVRLTWGQHFTVMRYAARVDGEWRDLEAHVEIERLPASPQDYKRRAHRALLENDVGYVYADLGGDGHHILAAPIASDPASWGLEEVWRWEGKRIYRVLEGLG